jgi:hypothetical protein
MTYHSCIGYADNKTVFRRGITILGLSDKTFPCIVIRFTLPTLHTQISFCSVMRVPFSEWRGCRGSVPATTVFCLIAREVSLRFDDFDEWLDH